MDKDNKEQENQSSLEDFFGADSEPAPPQKKPAEKTKEDSRKDLAKLPNANENDLVKDEQVDYDNLDAIRSSVDTTPPPTGKQTIGVLDTPNNLGPSYLLSVDYIGGNLKKAVVKLYDPVSREIKLWYDNTGHKPYCYTDYPPQVVESKVGNHRGYVGSQVVQVQDLLRDESRQMTKVIADDPLSIGGSSGAIRDLLVEHTPDMQQVSHAWEAAIRYRNCYSYDQDMVPGFPYMIEDGNLVKVEPKVDEAVLNEFKKTFGDEDDLERVIDRFAPMFFTSVPDIRRLAVDIEVYAPVKNRIPDPSLAEQPVTAISLVDNESFNKCFVLRRDGHPEGAKGKDYPKELDPVFFDDEAEMLIQAFRVLDSYPIVLSFVGDSFDLNYLYHRAERLKVDLSRFCPIRIPRSSRQGQEIAFLKGGIHIDLYKFLKNPSIRLYALSGAYERSSLEAIGQGLLGIGKLELSTSINDLPYYELAHYCWLDSKITMQITQYDENLVLRLIILLMRISRLSMEDVTRFGISSWIQSLFRQEHRSRNILIPQQHEIELLKSSTAQTAAMIKDKAFKGAIVIDPVPGVHFKATVLDFASLYPTIMKTHNISYETVDCPHEVCKNATDNRVPETDHWTCTINRGMISETIGFFRDTRVNWFKGKSKDKNLDEQTRNWYTVVEKALKVFVNACLPADEEVVVRTPSGSINKRKISEIKNVWQNLEILSIDKEFSESGFGTPVFVPIKGFSNTGKSELLKIRLHDGRVLSCTPNHVIPVLRPTHPRGKQIPKPDMSIQEIPAEDLKLDDEILTLQNIPLSESSPENLFIPDNIDNENLFLSVHREEYKKHSYRTNQATDNPLIQLINQQFKYSKASKMHKVKWTNLTKEQQHLIRNEARKGFSFQIKIGNIAGKWMNCIIPLTKEFFSFLGWYIAEGCTDKNRVAIAQYNQQNPTNCIEIESIIKKLGWPLGKYNGRQFVINSNILERLMYSLCGSGAKNKRVPIWLLDSDTARIVIDAYFKGDGNVNSQGNNRYSTASKQLARDLVMLLGGLGKFVSIQISDEGEMYRVVETKGHKYRRKQRGLVQFNGTYPVRVKTIDFLDSQSVYDIETENGWFVTSDGCVVHNSYGVTGAQHFELFCMPAAESVTAYGRDAIIRTKEKAESLGIRVLYGDTDSVFLDHPSKEQQEEMIEWSRKELGIDLEVEKTYKYVALSDRKKNYIGVYDSGYVEVKGLSGKKRNTPLFVQKAFQAMLDVLAKVDTPEGFESARDEIRAIVYTVIDRLEGKAEEYTPDELAFRIQITKKLDSYGVKPQHVRAALMLNEDTPVGTIIEFIKTKDEEGVLPVQMAKTQAYWIDKEKYIDTLKSVFGQVLDAVGLDFEGLMGFTTLDQFF